METLSSKRRIPIKNKYSDDFKQIYTTGFLGGFNQYDFRLAFFNDSLKHPEDPTASPNAGREIQGEVVMTHLAAKQLRDWLNKKLKGLDTFMGDMKKSELKSGDDSISDSSIYG